MRVLRFFLFLVVLPLIPIFDITLTLIRCSILLLAYPVYAFVALICFIFNKDIAFKIMNYWRKVSNIGTKYEEEI